MQRAQCRSPAMHLCLSEMCSVAPPGAHTDSPVPRPWSKEVRERVYFFHSNGVIEHYTEARWAHQKEQEAIAGEAKVNQTFRRLVRDGMTFDELGLDLTLLQHVRHRGSPKAVLQDEDVKMAVAMLVVAKTARGVHLPRYAQALWQLDQPARRPACALTAAELATSGGARLASFLAHGVVQVESVAEFGVDVAALSAQGIDALEHRGYGVKGNGMWSSVHPLPALEPMLRSEALAALLRGYLGGPVRYDGHFTFKLLDGISADKYISGHWHHDRCGRRVRMGILLHDVTPEGRPTEVALGSHNTLYWTQVAHVKVSRIQDRFVRSRYAVAQMTGKAGAAFILDTNALHRGLMAGVNARSVVFAEFHAHGKTPAL
jgi:hypothetical protein